MLSHCVEHEKIYNIGVWYMFVIFSLFDVEKYNVINSLYNNEFLCLV